MVVLKSIYKYKDEVKYMGLVGLTWKYIKSQKRKLEYNY